MWLKWLPWRFLVSRLARSQGFTDPISLLSRLHRFAQPSEVSEPIELLRAGALFHSRGLINARAIQHNLDWVWPFWVERQFDPHDKAFIPRSFSITHVNLTHRNWTAVGLPDGDKLPIVDPRGLVTPFFDGWSIDAWVIPHRGPVHLPSRCLRAEQELVLDHNPTVRTVTHGGNSLLNTEVDVIRDDGVEYCRVRIQALVRGGGRLAIAVRPVNPEGVSFIQRIRRAGPSELRINDVGSLKFDPAPERVCMSDYRRGDVWQDLGPDTETDAVECDIGMATSAALYAVDTNRPCMVTVGVPLIESGRPGPFAVRGRRAQHAGMTRWTDALRDTCQLRVPDERVRFLFDAAVRSLVLHSPADVYPGPFTYRRFWFRDAAFILEAMTSLGMPDRAERAIGLFESRQTSSGYFRSQHGEWDSNGEALWTIDRYRRMRGATLPDHLLRAVARGARWIIRKRITGQLERPHAGLMPAGFSAEHFGPNDYYYWDDFWSVAGLRAAAATLRSAGRNAQADECAHEADDLMVAIDRSIAQTGSARDRRGVPASPYRRMDSGAVGSLAAGYPLELWDARDPRLLDTVEFLLQHCMVDGGFFQDVIHSGINAYLTLHLAQVLLRAGDRRFLSLVETVSRLASATGQWPEAIHPHTKGGCMGDGQHVWAAAEWILMVRNMFVRSSGERLIIGSGVPRAWVESGDRLRFGPTMTRFGGISVQIETDEDGATVSWTAHWHDRPPRIDVELEGFEPVRDLDADASRPVVRLALNRSASTAGEVPS